ncbi:MAG: nuclear transport factor 2 family protein [Vicinamibacterales bacterium]
MSTEAAQNTQEIETILKTYETALNGNDIETILGLYGDSPIFMPQHAAALVGRDAVRAGYAHVFSTIKLSVRFDVHEVQDAGEWAWARTSSAGRTRILSSGAEVAEGNNELFVFRREKGAWKIHRYLFSTSQPPRA